METTTQFNVKAETGGVSDHKINNRKTKAGSRTTGKRNNNKRLKIHNASESSSTSSDEVNNYGEVPIKVVHTRSTLNSDWVDSLDWTYTNRDFNFVDNQQFVELYHTLNFRFPRLRNEFRIYGSSFKHLAYISFDDKNLTQYVWARWSYSDPKVHVCELGSFMKSWPAYIGTKIFDDIIRMMSRSSVSTFPDFQKDFLELQQRHVGYVKQMTKLPEPKVIKHEVKNDKVIIEDYKEPIEVEMKDAFDIGAHLDDKDEVDELSDNEGFESLRNLPPLSDEEDDFKDANSYDEVTFHGRPDIEIFDVIDGGGPDELVVDDFKPHDNVTVTRSSVPIHNVNFSKFKTGMKKMTSKAFSAVKKSFAFSPYNYFYPNDNPHQQDMTDFVVFLSEDSAPQFFDKKTGRREICKIADSIMPRFMNMKKLIVIGTVLVITGTIVGITATGGIPILVGIGAVATVSAITAIAMGFKAFQHWIRRSNTIYKLLHMNQPSARIQDLEVDMAMTNSPFDLAQYIYFEGSSLYQSSAIRKMYDMRSALQTMREDTRHLAFRNATLLDDDEDVVEIWTFVQKNSIPYFEDDLSRGTFETLLHLICHGNLDRSQIMKKPALIKRRVIVPLYQELLNPNTLSLTATVQEKISRLQSYMVTINSYNIESRDLNVDSAIVDTFVVALLRLISIKQENIGMDFVLRSTRASSSLESRCLTEVPTNLSNH